MTGVGQANKSKHQWWDCAGAACGEPECCVFCRIVAGDEPADVVRRWTDAIAIRPLNPVTQEHVLVLPKVHVRNFGSDPMVSAAVMHRAAEYGEGASRQWDYNVITSVGKLATQSVFHLHVHVVPRRTNDGLVLPWTAQQSGESEL